VSTIQASGRLRPRVRFTMPSTVVLAVVVLVALLVAPDVPAFAEVLLALAVVVACIAWHEGGHVLAAHALGFYVVEVRLGLLDSATVYEADHRTAHDRVLCALAGPAASLALAAVLGTLAWAQGSDLSSPTAASSLAVLNLVVAVANLVPFKGTDGWEVLAGLRGRSE